MRVDLTSELNVVRDELSRIESISQAIAGFPSELRLPLTRITKYSGQVDHWLNLIQMRDASRTMMAGLENFADSDDMVTILDAKIGFSQARFLIVQNYLSTTWELADCIAGFVSQVTGGSKPSSLFRDYVSAGGDKSSVAARSCLQGISMTYGFGRPLCVSNSLRNHFLHDGASAGGDDFFASIHVHDRFFGVTPVWWTPSLH